MPEQIGPRELTVLTCDGCRYFRDDHYLNVYLCVGPHPDDSDDRFIADRPNEPNLFVLRRPDWCPVREGKGDA